MKQQKQQQKPQTKAELTLQRIREGVESISEEDRHNSISEMKCAVCGKKLYWSCYAEDSYSVECVDCDLLYAEH